MKITFELNKWAKTVDLNYKNTVILVDENTKVHCLPILLRQIPKIDSSKIIVTKSGEQHKNLESCITIWQKLTELKLEELISNNDKTIEMGLNANRNIAENYSIENEARKIIEFAENIN